MPDQDSLMEVLRQAADVVAAAELPADLRPAAFAKAVDVLMGTSPESGRGRPTNSGSNGDPDDAIQRIASKLGLERELVDETFEVGDDDIRLAVARGKLEASKTGGTKQIAVLMAAARQAAGLEEHTSAEIIRAVADDFGKYDSANFSSSLNELGDYFSFSGTPRARELRVKRAGFEEAAASIRRLQA